MNMDISSWDWKCT